MTALLLAGILDSFPALILVFLFVLTIIQMGNKSKERRDRLRLLEEAIREGQLDEQMKADLMEGLGPKRRPHRQHRDISFSRLFFGIGWLMLFIGIGLLVTDEPDTFIGGCVVSAIGFGLVTMPLAYRELDSRHRQTS